MAKKDNDLFDRLRNAGLRKQVATRLSELSDDASKKASRAARSTASEFRGIADEIERRLPKSVRPASATRKSSSRTSTRKPSTTTRSRTATTRASQPTAASATRSRRAPASAPKRAPARKRTSASSASGARAPRGANKAKILQSLKSGPKTASEIAKETGIGAGTVGSTLSKMAISGEVRKAERGYGLPG